MHVVSRVAVAGVFTDLEGEIHTVKENRLQAQKQTVLQPNSVWRVSCSHQNWILGQRRSR